MTGPDAAVVFCSIGEAAQHCRVCVRTVLRWLAGGYVVAERLPGPVRELAEGARGRKGPSWRVAVDTARGLPVRVAA